MQENKTAKSYSYKVREKERQGPNFIKKSLPLMSTEGTIHTGKAFTFHCWSGRCSGLTSTY